MPWGMNVATCLCCGKQWIVGDCIPSVCDQCRDAGHTGVGCPVCKDNLDRICRRVEESQKAKATERFDAGLED